MNLHRSIILSFNHDLPPPKSSAPIPISACWHCHPLPTEAQAQTQNELKILQGFILLLSVPPCLGCSALSLPQGHTSLFGIVGFHAANVGGFFGHQDFHEFGEAVFELSCCLGEKEENYTWRDDWSWLQTRKIWREGFAFRSRQRVHVLKTGNSHSSLQLLNSHRFRSLFVCQLCPVKALVYDGVLWVAHGLQREMCSEMKYRGLPKKPGDKTI